MDLTPNQTSKLREINLLHHQRMEEQRLYNAYRPQKGISVHRHRMNKENKAASLFMAQLTRLIISDYLKAQNISEEDFQKRATEDPELLEQFYEEAKAMAPAYKQPYTSQPNWSWNSATQGTYRKGDN